MAVIEERYVIFNRAEVGGECGVAVLRYDLERGMQGPRELVFDTLDGQPLTPGAYSLDFIDRDYVRQAREPRSLSAPSFEGITTHQGRVVNDQRPRLRIVRDEDHAEASHAMTGADH